MAKLDFDTWFVISGTKFLKGEGGDYNDSGFDPTFVDVGQDFKNFYIFSFNIFDILFY